MAHEHGSCRIESDSAPVPLSDVPNREATRLISNSMPSSGAWLDIVPDNTSSTEFKSIPFVVALQRRFGYCLAHAPTLHQRSQ
jgi:hypothetical protein